MINKQKLESCEYKNVYIINDLTQVEKEREITIWKKLDAELKKGKNIKIGYI